jgi:hypothetical protein
MHLTKNVTVGECSSSCEGDSNMEEGNSEDEDASDEMMEEGEFEESSDINGLNYVSNSSDFSCEPLTM